MTKALSIDLLRIDADTQARVKISEETVDDYAEVIGNDPTWSMGTIHVFHDGTDYFVADGFHRTLAAIRVNRASLPCKIHKGTAKDARIFGMTANDQHGLRMSQADKRSCVEWLLDNGGKMTQKEVAAKAGVSIRMVSGVVADRKAVPYPPDGENTQSALSGDGYVSENPNVSEEPRPPRAVSGEREPRDPDVDLGKPEPASNEPPTREEWRIARSKAKKTVEALMRALCDLNDLKTVKALKSHLDDCGAIILELDAMK